jgi:transcriptional regulator of acetoin/glycerol metabolism
VPEWWVDTLRAAAHARPSDAESTRPTTPALPDAASAAPPVPSPVRPRRPDAATLRRLLAEHGGEMKALARALGVGRTTLYRWFEAAGVNPADLRD